MRLPALTPRDEPLLRTASPAPRLVILGAGFAVYVPDGLIRFTFPNIIPLVVRVTAGFLNVLCNFSRGLRDRPYGRV